MDCRVSEDVTDEGVVPGVRIRIPEVSNGIWELGLLDWEFDVVVNVVPDSAPKRGPNAGISLVNLDYAVLEDWFDM